VTPHVTEPKVQALVEVQVRRGLATRLLAFQPSAQVAHLVALAAIVLLLRGVVPPLLLGAWAVAVVLGVLARVAVTRWGLRRQPPFERMRLVMRLAMALHGLAWGVGAAAALRAMPTGEGLLVLAVFGTFVAGAATTLVADPIGFRLYALCILVPQAVGMLVAGPDRLYLVAVALIAWFALFMVRINGEAHRALVEHLSTAAELGETLANIKTLSGLLPICASCKKIRDDQGYWSQIEIYIRDHSDADFSHGLCPDCVRRLYPDLADELNAPGAGESRRSGGSGGPEAA
jgi:hypothetical protein